MSPKEALFTFTDGLNRWAKLEVQRRDVKDIKTALRVAESLVDFQRVEGLRDKGKKPLSGTSGGDEGESPKAAIEAKTLSWSKSKRNQSKGDEAKKAQGCFLCDGPHIARNCPTRKKLAVIIQELY